MPFVSQWLWPMSFKLDRQYVAASAFRFLEKGNGANEIKDLHAALLAGEDTVDVGALTMQPGLLAAGE